MKTAMLEKFNADPAGEEEDIQESDRSEEKPEEVLSELQGNARI